VSALSETKIVAALSTGLRVFNLSSSTITGLFAYKLRGCLICSDVELRRIPRVPRLLAPLSSNLRVGSRLLPLLFIGLARC
jgi:hypothetical protein